MAIPFHVMAMVIQNLGFRWRSEENQEHFLKEQNYNWALSKTGFGDMYNYYQLLVTSMIFSIVVWLVLRLAYFCEVHRHFPI